MIARWISRLEMLTSGPWSRDAGGCGLWSLDDMIRVEVEKSCWRKENLLSPEAAEASWLLMNKKILKTHCHEVRPLIYDLFLDRLVYFYLETVS